VAHLAYIHAVFPPRHLGRYSKQGRGFDTFLLPPFYGKVALDEAQTYLPCAVGTDGDGAHTDASGRALYHERVFDWLDEVV
jgi:hypothetical protein